MIKDFKLHSVDQTANFQRIAKASKGFLGLRSMGVLAPVSYLRTRTDWGVGDLDALVQLISFAKGTRISIISILPLNLPLYDNSPYSNASAFILDPVYIGPGLLKDFFETDSERRQAYSKEIGLIADTSETAAALRKNTQASFVQTRDLKIGVLEAFFERFKAVDLADAGAAVAAFVGGEQSDLDLKPQTPHMAAFIDFCISHRWLSEQLLYLILAEAFDSADFRKWPKEIATHAPEAVDQFKQRHSARLLFGFFVQWLLQTQLHAVRHKCCQGEFAVDLMLDQPFAFGLADIWCNLDSFLIDPKTLRRDCTQGAPPHRLDVPQHWEFDVLDLTTRSAKNLLLRRLSFYLQFSDFLRIDHLLGYYRIYSLTEDDPWKMTLEQMGIWEPINDVFQSDLTAAQKREKIYTIIVDGIRAVFPGHIVARLFEQNGDLKSSHVILAARTVTGTTDGGDHQLTGWYRQGNADPDRAVIYTLLSRNDISGIDYLEKIISEKNMFLAPSDSIRVGYFELGLGEEVLSRFMALAQTQGKTLVFENLGVVPDAVAQSLQELGASEFKPMIFGYQYFTGDHNEFWFDRIDGNSHVCFSTHDTVTVRGWWEGKQKWARKKNYFKTEQQKQAVLDYLAQQGYLDPSAPIGLDGFDPSLLRAVLASVADCNGREAVFLLSNLFGLGDEGIINMPGYKGFWTSRSPVTIDALLEAVQGLPPDSLSERGVALISDLVEFRDRHSFHRQLAALDPDQPHIICSHPQRRAGAKQIRFLGEVFLIDVIVYGRCHNASIVFDNGNVVSLQPVVVETCSLPGLIIFRKTLPVEESLLGVHAFTISLDDRPQPGTGYLIGLAPGTDANPLSETYGQIQPH